MIIKIDEIVKSGTCYDGIKAAVGLIEAQIKNSCAFFFDNVG